MTTVAVPPAAWSMRRRFLAGFTIVAAVGTLLHLYFAWRLAPLVPPVVIGILGVLPFVAFGTGRVLRGLSRAALEWLGYVALGVSSSLVLLVPVGDLVRLVTGVDARFSAAVVAALALGFAVVGIWQARRPSVQRVRVAVADLPAELAGLRIAQISDLHVSGTLGRRFIERVVRITNDLAPDLVAFTGDLADGLVDQVRHDVAPLAGLRAPLGKFYVTGNHEYYWDAVGWVREAERLGFHPLINAHHVVTVRGRRLLVAGITDHTAGPLVTGHRSDLGTALAGAPEADFRLLLAHQPSSALVNHRGRFHLQLSGHTHGGQYFPVNLLIRWFQPFVAGLHRVDDMWLYVSRGTGYWGPPMRFGAPAEITLIELVPGQGGRRR